MHNIYIHEDINDNTLLNFMNQVNNIQDKENIVVYLCSSGGVPSLVPIFRDIIERHQMRLVACGVVYSSAIQLFLTTNTPRTVLKDTIALVHRMTITGINTDKTGNAIVEEDLRKIWQETDDEQDVPPLFGMSKKDIKKMREGKDFYFDYKVVRKALKKSEEKFANKK